MNAIFFHLKIMLHSLRRGRIFTVINITGLAVSLAAYSFILLWVQDEKSYDRFHQDADEIYMGVANFTNEGLPSPDTMSQ
jgi:hypothetical protein